MIKAFALLVALAFALPARLGAQALADPVCLVTECDYPVAEYDCAATVVMHEPGYELFVGTMHPAAALFMDYFDADKAAAEHEGYQRILRDPVQQLSFPFCYHTAPHKQKLSCLNKCLLQKIL